MDILSFEGVSLLKTNFYKPSTPIKEFRSGSSFPTEILFRTSGATYRRISSNRTKHLYEVTTDGGCTYYEVFLRGRLYRENPVYKSTTIAGGEEVYPRNEDFGEWAWCYCDEGRAVRCFLWDRVAGRPDREVEIWKEENEI